MWFIKSHGTWIEHTTIVKLNVITGAGCQWSITLSSEAIIVIIVVKY